jgi:hypothetical protein
MRSLITEVSLLAALDPATGVAVAIFTFYMAPDPATSHQTTARPSGFRSIDCVRLHGIDDESHRVRTVLCVGCGLYFPWRDVVDQLLAVGSNTNRTTPDTGHVSDRVG